MALRRPDLSQALHALMVDIASTMPEFAHIKPSRIVVVAGEARRASRATVKPLTFAGGKSRDRFGRRKPVVKLKGKRILYCITLRPLFFRDSTPQARIATLLHELFHVSSRFDGTLHAGRRHAALGKAFAKRLKPLVRRYLKICPEPLSAPFAYDGEVRMLQWLERPGPFYLPGSGSVRREYTEAHLYSGTVRMLTGKEKRKGRVKRGKLPPELQH